jgi:hypothetical protein
MPGSRETRRRTRWRALGWSLVAFWLANFTAFAISIEVLGGEAFSGRREEGRYFLGNHGQHPEVSRATYVYSMTQGIAMIATFPLAVVGGFMARRDW